MCKKPWRPWCDLSKIFCPELLVFDAISVVILISTLELRQFSCRGWTKSSSIFIRRVTMRAPLAVHALLLVAIPAIASAMTIDDLVVGTTVSGPKLTVAEMKGKVDYVVYWGTH